MSTSGVLISTKSLLYTVSPLLSLSFKFRSSETYGCEMHGGTYVNTYALTNGFFALSSFKFAPITSVDVERSFSKYKTLLSDKRYSFTESNFEMHLVVNYNAN